MGGCGLRGDGGITPPRDGHQLWAVVVSGVKRVLLLLTAAAAFSWILEKRGGKWGLTGEDRRRVRGLTGEERKVRALALHYPT